MNDTPKIPGSQRRVPKPEGLNPPVGSPAAGDPPAPNHSETNPVGPRLNVDDWERAARSRLSDMAYGYYVSGSDDEITLRENRSAFSRMFLRYRVLRDVSRRDLGTTVLGHELPFPLMVAPSAFHQLATPEGEVATAGAASEHGTIMILSTLSNRAVEDVVAASQHPVWFQLYIYKDREITGALVDRVVAAGCKAIVLTVDAPKLGRRERDMRTGFHLPEGIRMENFLPDDYRSLPQEQGESGLASYAADLLDPSIQWSDLEWLVQRAPVPVLVKGIVHPDDAVLALKHGAKGIVVSNHGGRQLDTSIPSIQALSEVRRAVSGHSCQDGSLPVVLMDGGVRRGTDILKAVALGADAVLVGRPILWGLAVEGREGASKVLSLLHQEFDLAMALAGCRCLDEVTEDLLAFEKPAHKV